MWPTCTLYSRWIILLCQLDCRRPRWSRTAVNAHASEHRTAHTTYNTYTIQYVIQHRNQHSQNKSECNHVNICLLLHDAKMCQQSQCNQRCRQLLTGWHYQMRLTVWKGKFSDDILLQRLPRSETKLGGRSRNNLLLTHRVLSAKGNIYTNKHAANIKNMLVHSEITVKTVTIYRARPQFLLY